MSELLVIARDPNPGDALMCLPAICGLAEKHSVVYLAMTNREVLEIADLPKNVIDVTTAEPAWRNKSLPVQMLGVGAAVGYRFPPNMMPTINCVMAYAGLEVDPSTVPRPHIKEVDGHALREFAVILAPWARDPVRSLTMEQATEIIYKSPAQVLTIGGKGDEDLKPPWPQAYGDSFRIVAARMLVAEVVVTVDSFPSRLAHAAGVKHHIILNSGATPIQCQTYPGAQVISAKHNYPTPLWDIDEIVSAIEGALSANSSLS